MHYKQLGKLQSKSTLQSISPTISYIKKNSRSGLQDSSSNEMLMGTGVGKAGAIKNTHHGQ